MVEHHVGATKKTDVNRELTNCNEMLIKKYIKKVGKTWRPECAIREQGAPFISNNINFDNPWIEEKQSILSIL